MLECRNDTLEFFQRPARDWWAGNATAAVARDRARIAENRSFSGDAIKTMYHTQHLLYLLARQN